MTISKAVSGHTPSPWRRGDFCGSPSRDIVAENGFVIAQVSGPSRGARGKEWHEENECSEANAHLIAAAPDLLEALKRMHLACTNFSCVPSEDDVKAAIAAIAKAEGR